MEWDFELLKTWFQETGNSSLLLKGTWGLEKESHRVTSDGELSQLSHPEAFGDKLENPQITTDFSESQLELVTAPQPTIEKVWAELEEIHNKVDSGIGEELLWPLSMPPKLPDDENISIARYNDTEQGRAQEKYRAELAIRYGKKMQMISGLHYNFGFHSDLLDLLYERWGKNDKQSFVNELYVSLARNFLRNRWLLIYLFGASPVADPTYDSVIQGELEKIEACCSGTFFARFKDEREFVTSLRVSRFGYSNTAQSEYPVSFNSLDEYVRDIEVLLNTVCPTYESLGLENPHVLQNENEFYSSIRLKRNAEMGKRPLNMLKEKGVEYIEIRIMDLNPYERIGITLQQLRFIHLFTILCLFEASPFISEQELQSINNNHHLVSLFGRKPNVTIESQSGEYVLMKTLLEEKFTLLFQIAALMDQTDRHSTYQKVVLNEYKKVKDVQLVPSAMIQREMEQYGESISHFGMRRAIKNKKITTTGRMSECF